MEDLYCIKRFPVDISLHTSSLLAVIVSQGTMAYKMTLKFLLICVFSMISIYTVLSVSLQYFPHGRNVFLKLTTNENTPGYGDTELRQLYRYVAQTMGVKFDYGNAFNALLNSIKSDEKRNMNLFSFTELNESNHYAYVFSEPYLHRSSSFQICVDLEEYDKGDLTTGGTSLLGETYMTLPKGIGNICVYKDLENGYYTVCCEVLGAVQTINITSAYVDYEAFQGTSMRSTHIYFQYIFVEELYAKLNQTQPLDKLSIWSSYWAHDNINSTVWRWYTNGKPHTSMYTGKQLAWCLNQKYTGGIIMVGDSHVRMMYNVFAVASGLPLKKLPTLRNRHSGKKFKDITFLWAAYSENVAKSLSSKISKLKPSQNPTMFILNTGSHILHTNGVVSFFMRTNTLVQKLTVNMGTLREKRPNVKVFWLDMPSQLDHYSTHYDPMHWRNQFSAAALNKWLCDRLLDLNIHCIHFGALSSYMRNHVVCRGHYLCIGESKDGVTGSAGIQVINQLVQQAC